MAENSEPKQAQDNATQTDAQEKERTETESIFHRMYLFGVGLQKDIEQTVENLIERGQVEAGERQKVVSDLLKGVKQSGEHLEGKLEQFVNDALEKMNLVTMDKYEALEKRLNALEQRIKELHPDN